jgi:hypothetical protein
MKPKKPKKPKSSKRNPIAKAVTTLRPKIVPNTHHKKLADAKKREISDSVSQKDD